MDTNTELSIKYTWSEEHENILTSWADKAMCYKWLHDRAHQRLAIINAWFTIPVIILSTLTGTANFAQDRFPENYKSYIVMGIGGLNIIAGIITTIQQFLKISEKNEAHRVSAIAWGKFYRNITIELAKKPCERVDPIHMIKTFKEEYDRLSETSPIIPILIINIFNKTFVDTDNFSSIIKPDICDTLRSSVELKFKDTMPTIVDNFNDIENGIEFVNDITDKFEKLHNRKPFKDEIEDCVNNISIDHIDSIKEEKEDTL